MAPVVGAAGEWRGGGFHEPGSFSEATAPRAVLATIRRGLEDVFTAAPRLRRTPGRPPHLRPWGTRNYVAAARTRRRRPVPGRPGVRAHRRAGAAVEARGL